jgi:hypothetical protein
LWDVERQVSVFHFWVSSSAAFVEEKELFGKRPVESF